MHNPYALRRAVKPAHSHALGSNLYKGLVKASRALLRLMHELSLHNGTIFTARKDACIDRVKIC